MELLAKLADDPAWGALSRVAEELMERHFRGVARDFMTRNVQPDYARLQWQRGVFAGIKFLLDSPHIQEKKLERLLAQLEGSDDA